MVVGRQLSRFDLAYHLFSLLQIWSKSNKRMNHSLEHSTIDPVRMKMIILF